MNFEQAAEQVNQLSESPDNNTLLKLYSMYKQGSQGDVTDKRPGMMDILGRAKWDAWKKLEGTDPQAAQSQYVQLVEELLEKDKARR